MLPYAPITASVARVAFKMSDSNHRSRMLVAGAVNSSYSGTRVARCLAPTDTCRAVVVF